MGDVGTLLSWGAEGWLDDIARGVAVTIGLAAATLPFGLVVGFLIALAKMSDERSLRLAGNIYTTIFRGLPELLTLFLVYFGAQIALQNAARLIQPDATIAVSSFVSGLVALGVVFSSYASEVFHSAFRAIPRGQYEGGYSVGLSRAQTMRLVILPQLIRIALPGLGNQWMVLLKDTALVSAIGLGDILRQSYVAARATRETFLFYGLAMLLYLGLAILSSLGMNAMERRARRGER